MKKYAGKTVLFRVKVEKAGIETGLSLCPDAFGQICCLFFQFCAILHRKRSPYNKLRILFHIMAVPLGLRGRMDENHYGL